MDTIVSNPSVAMGHGQQQAVHPFFCQDFGLPSHSTPSEPETSTFPPPNVAFTPEAASLGNRPPNINHEPETMAIESNADQVSEIPVSLSPETDPNAGRRKRRKTEKSKQSDDDAPLQTRLAGWLGKDISTPQAPAQVPIDPTLGSIMAPPPQPLPEPTSHEATPADPAMVSDSAPSEPVPERKRKIVKLNINGRLLSSSPPVPAGNTTQKPPVGKRGRPRKTESKLAVLKYGTADNKKLANLVEDILHGRATHKPAPVNRVTPAQPKTNKPAKPTHPFFLKKTTQEAQPDCIPDTKTPETSNQKSTINQTSQDTPVTKREPRTFASFQSTRSRIAKFPELIEPLWPPQHMAHVRSIDPPQPDNSDFTSCQNDQRKSKLRVVSVHDDENALLLSTSRALEVARTSLQEDSNVRPTLRIPGRHIASGRVLQTAIESQMSWASDPRCARYSSLPVLSNLRSTLTSSFSAFDCGKYEPQLWAHKYAPQTAEYVLQLGREAHVLRDWLQHLKITAVDTGKPPKESSKSKSERKQKKKKKQKDKLDGFIISSGEEDSEMDNLSGSDDELAGDVTVSTQKTVIRSGDLARITSSGEKNRLTNAILLSGPPGSGKTASVYAVAKELDFEIFEINAGTRRSARDMLEKVGDMTQNHLVYLLNETDALPAKPRVSEPVDEAKQNRLMSFFKSNSAKDSTPTPDIKNAKGSPKPQADEKSTREQKQSLILLEEADILFEEDKQFWTGVLTLISQSRRPIVITCNDESLLPTQSLSLHAILRYQKPARDLAIDYLLLVAANEGHVLKRDAVSKLFDASGMDVRRSLMDLNFWCQIGVGSDKAGLDWILPCWPPEANTDENGDRKRVLSLNTYEPYMGWFNRDHLLDESSLEKETEALKNTLHWWRLGIQDSEDAAGPSSVEKLPHQDFPSKSKMEQLELLDREMDYLDMRSSLDILSSRCQLDMFQDVVDISAPPIPETHRSNYVEAYPLLQASIQPEYTALSETISLSFSALISRVFRTCSPPAESIYASQMFNGWRQSAVRRSVFPSNLVGFQKVFEPITRYNYMMTLTTGRIAPSFENTLSPITEDIAPYIRSIMVFDGRLKQYRDHLSALTHQHHGHGEKRQRNTRASRAALEGGSKASIRKERWFPDDTNYFLVQNTGKPEWQEALFQLGHFQIQPVVEQAENHGEHNAAAPDE